MIDMKDTKDEILDLFAAGNYLEISVSLKKLEKQDKQALFEIAIKNNYVDLIVLLMHDNIDFIQWIQGFLELSIENIEAFCIFNMLLNRWVLCPDVVAIDPVRLLFCSVEHNNIPDFFVITKELFFQENYNIDQIVNLDGETLLMVAAKNKHNDLLKLMIQFYNADLNKAIDKGYCTADSVKSFYETEEANDSSAGSKVTFSV